MERTKRQAKVVNASCPHCLGALYVASEYCPYCGVRLEPVETAEVKLPGRRPPLVVVIGIWILVIPLAGFAFASLTRVGDENPLASVGYVVLLLLYAAVLYRVTKRYVSAAPIAEKED